MGSDVSRDHYQGVLIPDTRLELWADESSYTQAGPRPGVPDPAQSTAMVLRSAGTQAAGTTYQVRAQRGGYPDDTAALVWRSGTSGDWYGWEPGYTVSDLQHIVWVDETDSGRAIHSTRDPHLLALPSGEVLIAYQDRNAAATPDTYRVVVRKRTAAGVWGSAIEVYTQESAPTFNYFPCLLRLPNGRIVCYLNQFDDDYDQTNIRAYYSDDDGATWALYTPAALNQGIDVTSGEYQSVGRTRVAYANGQVLLVTQADRDSGSTRGRLIQYASSDLGQSFERVSVQGTSADEGGYPDVIAAGGGFLVGYISSSTFRPEVKLIGSAFDDLEASDYIDVDTDAGTTSGEWADNPLSSGVLTGGELALSIDESGIVWLHGIQVSSAYDGVAYLSRDGGRSWMLAGQSSNAAAGGARWTGGGWDVRPRWLATTWSQGRCMVASTWSLPSSTDYDTTLSVQYLGGYTSLELPPYTAFGPIDQRVAWEWTWQPVEIPSVSALASAVGTPATEALGSTGLALETAPTNRRAYSYAPTATIGQEIICRVIVAVTFDADASTTNGRVGLQVRLDDGAEGYDVLVSCTSTGYGVVDDTSAAQIGSDVTVSMTSPVEILVALAAGQVRVWHRPVGAGHARAWTLGVSGSVSDNAGATGANLIEWGHVTAASSGNPASVWSLASATYGVLAAGGMAAGRSNPADLAGRPISSAGTYIDGGMSVSAIDGPATRADQWTIATRYDYGIDRLDLPSPRVAWRSTSTAEQQIAYRLDTLGEADPLSDVLGFAFLGGNFSQVVIQGYDVGTSAWVTLATANLTNGLVGLHAARYGSTWRPSGTANNGAFMLENEYAGGYFGDASNRGRKIVRHTAGTWSAGSVLAPRLHLDGVQSGDPSTTTTGRIWPSSSVVLVHMQGERYQGYRVVIPAPSGSAYGPQESYYTAGRIVIGPVYLWADQYSWGRRMTLEDGVELGDADDGTRSSYVAAPPRRIYEWSWQDGIDESAVRRDDPDIVFASEHASAEAVGAVGATPEQVVGLVHAIDGAHTPIVYLPRVERSDGATRHEVLTRRGSHCYGRWIGGLDVGAAQGDELSDEVIRLEPAQFVEEL